MDQPDQRLDALEKKVDELQRSVHTIKRIFFWLIMVSLALFLLPLIGLLFVIPQFLSIYSGALQ